MAGRKKIAPAKPGTDVDIVEKTPKEIAAKEAVMHGATEAYSEERDLLNQLLGQIQTSDAFAQFSRTVSTSKLAYVKEIKAYKALAGRKTADGQQFSGTWGEFCQLLGRSQQHVDEDIRNVRALGEEALESMSRMGIGYRELRQYRRLPSNDQEALIEAAKSGDKDSLLDLAEELIARQQKEKAKLQAEVEDVRADNEAKDARAQTRERTIENLQKQLRQAKGQRERATPDEEAERLKRQFQAAALGVEIALTSEDADTDCLRNRTRDLIEHARAHERDVLPYLAGVFAQLERMLWLVRDEFGIPHAAVGDPEKEAAMTLGEAL